MNLVLLGAPGAGKGTLAGLLKIKLGILHISTGDMLRDEIKKESGIGLEAKSYIARGELVPDDLVTRLIELKLSLDPQANQGYMLDGFPRNLKQAGDLDNILNKINLPIEFALDLAVSLPKITSRLSGRRVCKSCGATYHITNRPPKISGVCDACSGILYQRADDNEETIKTRLEIYNKNTAPIIDYYKIRNILVSLDSDLESEELFETVLPILNGQRKAHHT